MFHASTQANLPFHIVITSTTQFQVFSCLMSLSLFWGIYFGDRFCRGYLRNLAKYRQSTWATQCSVSILILHMSNLIRYRPITLVLSLS